MTSLYLYRDLLDCIVGLKFNDQKFYDVNLFYFINLVKRQG